MSCHLSSWAPSVVMMLMCFAENTRARRTYERIGFVQEAVLREEYRHEERWHDMVRYSVLAREWQRAS